MWQEGNFQRASNYEAHRMQCPAVRTPLVVAKLQPGPMGAVIPLNPAQAISSLHLSRGLQSNYGSNDAIARSRSPCDISGQICFDTVFFFFFSSRSLGELPPAAWPRPQQEFRHAEQLPLS